MTINIDFTDILDIRQLADIAQLEYDIMCDPDSWETEVKDARQTLEALKSMLTDIGQGNVSDEDLSSALIALSRSTGPTMYASNHFVKSMEELSEHLGHIPNDLPDYIVIDWEATAAKLQQDYSKVYFDKKEYLVHR